MQILLRGDVYFVRVFFYIHACSFTWMLLITHAFTQKYFYTETPLHRDALAQGCFPTQTRLLTRNDFYREMILHWATLHTDAKTNRGAVTKECVCTASFYLWALLRHDFRRRTRIWRKRVQQTQFHHSCWGSRRISWERVGPAQAHIAIWPQCMTIDTSCERLAFRGHQSMPPWRSKKNRKHQDKKLISHLPLCTCVYPLLGVFKKIDLHLHLYIFRNTPAYIRLVAVFRKILWTCTYASAPKCLSVRLKPASTLV